MRNYLVSAWVAIDPIYYIFTRLTYVLDNEQHNTLFRVRLTRYKGDSIVLTDGTMIHKNDLLLKIHLHNARILHDLHHINSEVKRAVFVYHMVKRALPRLARYVLAHQKRNEIKGVIGITTLYRGANRLGFEVIPIRNTYYRQFKKGTFFLINLLANKQGSEKPVYLFMSKVQLAKKYMT